MPTPVSRAAASRAAAPLPDPYPALAKSRYGVQLLRAQFSMIAGPPGGGKTMFALLGALRMNVPTLYVSADSDETTMAARLGAAVTGHTFGAVKRAIEAGMFQEVYGEALADCKIRFMFDPSEPSLKDIAQAVNAWVELWGEPPELIIIDNVMNVESEVGDEWQGMRRVAKDIHYLARKTKAHVQVLHHTSEQDPKWVTSAPPRGAIQGKISQLPALIITLAYNQGEMWVAVVKNRMGEADSQAENPVRMLADFSRVRIDDEPMAGGVMYRSGRVAA